MTDATTTPTDDAPKKVSRWRAMAVPWLLLAVGGLLLCSVAGRGASAWWQLELFSHFALQYLVCAAVALLLAGWLRSRLAAGLAIAALLLNGVLVAPLYVSPSDNGATGTNEARPQVTVCSFNVEGRNQNYDGVVSYLRQSPCDVVFMLELRHEWLAAMNQLAPDYQVVIAEPRDDNFGIAMLSRSDGAKAKIIRGSGSDIGFIDATIRVGERPLALLAVHPPPPVSSRLADVRNAALEQMAAWAKTHAEGGVVIGDFNLTSFSPYFSQLLDDGDLVDSTKGFGPQTSWPDYPDYLRPFSIAIDHAVHTRNVLTVKRHIGKANGSDHRPLFVTLELAP